MNTQKIEEKNIGLPNIPIFLYLSQIQLIFPSFDYFSILSVAQP